MEGRGGDAAGFRAPGGPAALHDLGPHQQCRDRPVRRPRLRRGQRRRRRQAAGIARRTLFRYYPSKNALPWGDFDAHLDHMRDLLDDLDPDVPIGEALRTALLAFNTFDEPETARHRQRMRVILETAALQAYSMTMYAGWRAVVAAFVARAAGRQGRRPGAADRGVDDARRRAVGLRALAGRRVGVAGRGTGRCVRHGQRRAGGAGLNGLAEKILDWGVGVRAAAATIRV